MRLFVLIIISMLLEVVHLQGQTCNGTLGDNLFLDGDFGSGAANIPTNDPGLAPGYSYATSTPLQDGFYTITNDISQWANSYNWLKIQDNSPDPEGYMMVVNADFSPGVFYEKQITGLCPNTLYEFSADIINLHFASNVIKPNVTFLIDNQVSFTTGDIPENTLWNTYGFTFSTQPGQTSLTLSLANNAPGGIGNDFAVDNISFRPCGPELSIIPGSQINLCENDSSLNLDLQVIGNQYNQIFFQWQQSFDNGLTFSDILGATDSVFSVGSLTPGTYIFLAKAANSAQSLSNANCIVNSPIKTIEVLPVFFENIDTICDNLTYSFGSQSISTPGNYSETFVGPNGCDSIVSLTLRHAPRGLLNAQLNVTSPLCYDSINGAIETIRINNGNGPYQFKLNNANVERSPNGLSPGQKQFEITDRYGCSWDTTFTITKPDKFELTFFEDTSILLGQPLYVNTSSNFPLSQYKWNPPIVLCDSNCEGFDYFPPSSMHLKLIGINESNCVATDSIKIEVNPEKYLEIPAAFTPNKDGKNDYFYPIGIPEQIKQIDKFQIFDQWGNEIILFEDLPYPESPKYWDGTINGNPVPIGTYAYKFQVRFIDGVVLFYKGTVTLYR